MRICGPLDCYTVIFGNFFAKATTRKVLPRLVSSSFKPACVELTLSNLERTPDTDAAFGLEATTVTLAQVVILLADALLVRAATRRLPMIAHSLSNFNRSFDVISCAGLNG